MDYCFFLVVVAYISVSFLSTSNGVRVWNEAGGSTFNVLDYGAVGDGQKDDTQAFSKAWAELCGATGGNPTLIVPADKTFLLKPISFKGPCKSPTVHFKIDGKMVAPDNVGSWGISCQSYDSWLSFENVENLHLDGPGELDGRGSVWWGEAATIAYDLYAIDVNGGSGNCNRPSALSILNCNGLQLQGLTHKDSPQGHIRIMGCNNSTLSNLHIIAPEDSPNTDGIDISAVTNVQIRDSIISTGDDCIAIGSPSSWINITGVTCGPGHGISVGSLGRGGEKAEVEEIHVRNCTFKKSTNGARIKTWQGGSGYARKITFEDIPLIDVSNPIIIDQFYCIPPGTNCQMQPMGVAVSDVTYNGFQGTSASPVAITLNCSKTTPCTNIVLKSIEITPSNSAMQIQSVSENAKCTQTSVKPAVPCFR